MATAPGQMFGALALAVLFLALSVLPEASGAAPEASGDAAVVVVPGDGGIVSGGGGGASGYGEEEFLADYKNPKVPVIQVKGDVVLTADLPELTRKVSILGVGTKRPVIDGQNKYSGIVSKYELKVGNLEFTRLVTSRVPGGAAVFASGANNEFTNCLFRNNVALGSGASGFGGAVYVNTNVKWKVTDCEFLVNRAEQVGGGLYVFINSPGELIGTRFIDNIGGGAFVLIGSTARVHRTLFKTPT